jgi:hypothetical protein
MRSIDSSGLASSDSDCAALRKAESSDWPRGRSRGTQDKTFARRIGKEWSPESLTISPTDRGAARLTHRLMGQADGASCAVCTWV